MVARANKAYGELGGHIASYASAAEIFEVGFNHFFKARTADDGGDLVYFQPHSAPGLRAPSWKVVRVRNNWPTFARRLKATDCVHTRIHG